jgi:hypothetical protein
MITAPLQESSFFIQIFTVKTIGDQPNNDGGSSNITRLTSNKRLKKYTAFTTRAFMFQEISLPLTWVTLDGSASKDDVNISSYAWSQVSGPNQVMEQHSWKVKITTTF